MQQFGSIAHFPDRHLSAQAVSKRKALVYGGDD